MKKPIAVLMTDTHIKPENISLVIDIFNQAKALCKKLGVKHILHAGDWFNNRQGQPLMTLIVSRLIIQSVYQDGLKIIGIPGNHDKTDLDAFESYLDLYEQGFDNLREGGKVSIGKLDCYFLPYFKSEKYLDLLSSMEVDKSRTSVLITHQGITGVRNNDGSLVENDIEPKLFKKFKFVYVGHYHNSSKVGKNIIYFGSTYQANYGETIEDKGFKILYEDGSVEHFETEFPKYIKVKIDASNGEEIAEKTEEYSNSSDNIRFVFHGSKTDIDKVKQTISSYSDLGIDVKFESDDYVEAIEDVENNELIEYDKGSIMEEFSLYCEQLQISTEKFNWGFKFLQENI